jgi:hypothetical protein
MLSWESSSTAKKGGKYLMACDWESFCKEICKILFTSYQGQIGLGIGLDQYDHVANGTACPKILTSLDIRCDWLDQSRPRCRKKWRLLAEGVRLVVLSGSCAQTRSVVTRQRAPVRVGDIGAVLGSCRPRANRRSDFAGRWRWSEWGWWSMSYSQTFLVDGWMSRRQALITTIDPNLS